jgi:N-acetylneuraminic acid mutarotase
MTKQLSGECPLPVALCTICLMKQLLAFLVLLPCAALLLGAEKEKNEIPSMPFAVSSNAVASIRGGLEIYSMMGVGPRKTWDDITNQVYVLNLAHPKWTVGHQVPGVVGRLGAAAVGVRDAVFLMGGYMVDGEGKEIDIPDVNVYEPQNRKWFRSKDMLVAVDNAAIGATRNRYIYLIGGRSSNGPVNSVQVYDVQTDNWNQATPFPGTPVFGLAGGIADENIVIVDGAKAGPSGGPRYVASDECWLGKIDRKNPNKIEWSKLPAHPGKARFAMASGGSDRERKVIFSGGTTTPHGYNGVAYDEQPSEVSTLTFDYDVHHRQWETVSKDTPDARADARGIVFTAIGPLVLGGMAKDLSTTSQATQLPTK